MSLGIAVGKPRHPYPWRLDYWPMGQILGRVGFDGYIGYGGLTCMPPPPAELAAGWLGCVTAAALPLWWFQNLGDRVTS